MKIIKFFVKKKKKVSTFVEDFNNNKANSEDIEVEIITPKFKPKKEKKKQLKKEKIVKEKKENLKQHKIKTTNIKKEKKLIYVVANLVIICMLIIMGGLTLNFNSQYVFSYKNDEAIYHGNKNLNHVSLMINVYWGTEFLDSILNTLESYNVKATFFVGGQWVEKEQNKLKEIYDKGHEIGNHGYFHRNHDKLSYDQNYEEINVNHKLVKSTINYEMNLFAPPSGAYNKTTLNVANALGYKTILWSRDTIDWRDKDSELIFKRATDKIKGGDLILMHPTNESAQALPKILEYYKNNNLLATTVTNNLKV